MNEWKSGPLPHELEKSSSERFDEGTAHLLGVHPLAWALTLAVDIGIFGGNLSGFWGYFVLLLVAGPLWLALTLMQWRLGRDSFGKAIVRALGLVGLVAVPTPIASLAPAVVGWFLRR